MLLYGSCSKIVQESPETITISGHITDEDGQPVENVSLDLMYITRMNLLGFYYGTGIHAKTDENGYYSIQFDNNDDYSYRVDIEKAGYHYVQSYSVDRWIASQEHDVVMRKNTSTSVCRAAPCGPTAMWEPTNLKALVITLRGEKLLPNPLTVGKTTYTATELVTN